jgi:hypothetical protein
VKEKKGLFSRKKSPTNQAPSYIQFEKSIRLLSPDESEKGPVESVNKLLPPSTRASLLRAPRTGGSAGTIVQPALAFAVLPGFKKEAETPPGNTGSLLGNGKQAS